MPYRHPVLEECNGEIGLQELGWRRSIKYTLNHDKDTCLSITLISQEVRRWMRRRLHPTLMKSSRGRSRMQLQQKWRSTIRDRSQMLEGWFSPSRHDASLSRKPTPPLEQIVPYLCGCYLPCFLSTAVSLWLILKLGAAHNHAAAPS